MNPDLDELVTFELTYPRFIHAEFMTYRCFSRNAASSRAIPLSKTIKAVIQNPAVPEFWGANQKGMQAAKQLTGWRLQVARALWETARWLAVGVAWLMEKADLHKQIANRLLEPWLHITVIATTGMEGLRNFFALRAHPDAQPEFQVLAYRMLDAYMYSIPDKLEWGEWHLPFGDYLDASVDINKKLAVCTGRVARVSYLTHDGRCDMEADVALHDRLKTSGHWSPFEHCAYACHTPHGSNLGRGWTQYLKLFTSECQAPDRTRLETMLCNRPGWFEL